MISSLSRYTLLIPCSSNIVHVLTEIEYIQKHLRSSELGGLALGQNATNLLSFASLPRLDALAVSAAVGAVTCFAT